MVNSTADSWNSLSIQIKYHKTKTSARFYWLSSQVFTHNFFVSQVMMLWVKLHFLSANSCFITEEQLFLFQFFSQGHMIWEVSALNFCINFPIKILESHQWSMNHFAFVQFDSLIQIWFPAKLLECIIWNDVDSFLNPKKM